MRFRLKVAPAALLVLPLLGAVSCAKVQSKAAFKDGNKQYKEEDWKNAVKSYEKAVSLDPAYAEAYFYLGSSHQAMFRPGKESPDNKAHLDAAIDSYKKSLEVNKAETPNQKTVRMNTLGALTAIYSDDPYKSYDTALGYAKQLVETNANDPKNLYAMANLYEKFGKIQEAEDTYKKVSSENPKDSKACGAYAGFLNKPLWEGKSKFDEAIATLERCASIDPNDASAWQKVATFYWDKAYRDPLLTDEQKAMYADKGLEAVQKALSIKPDYWEALIFKGLLLRVKGSVASNPRLRAELMDEAAMAQKQAMDLKKAAAAGEAAAGAAPAPAPPAQ